MNPETFLDRFGQLAKTPNGIKKLRELILQLAVQGKLVPQDPNDEPASELLKRIEAEKQRMVVEKKIRKPKEMPPVADEEKGYSLPQGWEWTRLGEVGDWGAGATPKRGNANYYGGHIPWFKSGELTGGFIDESEETITDQALAECSLRRNKADDVLIAMYGATIGKTAILAVDGTTNQAVCACTPYTGLSNLYLHLLLKAKITEFTKQGAGGAQPNISREKIIATVMALPPLAEQHCIGAKVDELMALCDELEAKQQQRTDTHTQLLRAVHHPLTEASAAAELQPAWQRVRDHFDQLYITPESVQQLRQTILQLAVQGKLVPQDANDEPASGQLKRTEAKKQRLVASRQIKKPKSLPPISEQDKPYLLPEGWEWVSISHLAHVGTGTTPSKSTPDFYNPATVPWVTSGETRELYISETQQKVSEVAVENTNLTIYPKHTLIMAMYGQGKTRGQISELLIEACTNQACAAIMLFDEEEAHRKYVKYFFIKSYQEIRAGSAGGAQPNLNIAKVKSTLVPLPPVAEQRRIVTKLSSMIGLCDALESRLQQSQVDGERLMESVVAHLAAA